MATRRRMVSVALAAGLTLGPVLSACGLSGDDDADPPATTTSAPTTTTTPQAALEVLDAGAEPRQLLEVRLTTGDRTTVELTTDLEVDQESSGRRQRLDSPPITQKISYEVLGADDAGADVSLRIDEVTVDAAGTGLDDQAVLGLQAELDPLAGTTGRARITPQGRFSEVSLQGDVASDDQLAETAAQIEASAPGLPEVEVGAGARWKTTATTVLQGARMEVVTTTTLVGVENGTMTYSAEVAITADAQDLAVGPDTTARLESADLRGTSTGNRSLPTLDHEFRTELSGTQELTIDGTDGPTAVTQTVRSVAVARPGTP